MLLFLHLIGCFFLTGESHLLRCLPLSTQKSRIFFRGAKARDSKEGSLRSRYTRVQRLASTFLVLGFLVYKMGIIIGPPAWVIMRGEHRAVSNSYKALGGIFHNVLLSLKEPRQKSNLDLIV